MTRVLVCGGRHYADMMHVYRTLDVLHMERRITCVIQGGASGADMDAATWAVKRGVRDETFNADWKQHGRAAGPIRNQRMLDEGKPDLVVAFPGGRGTADMVRRAKAAGVPVMEIDTQARRAIPPELLRAVRDANLVVGADPDAVHVQRAREGE